MPSTPPNATARASFPSVKPCSEERRTSAGLGMWVGGQEICDHGSWEMVDVCCCNNAPGNLDYGPSLWISKVLGIIDQFVKVSQSFCESCFLLLDVVSYNLFNTSECCTFCMIDVYECTYKGVTCYTNIVIRAHLFPMLDCLAPMIGSTTKPQETWNQVIDVMMWHHEVLGWFQIMSRHSIPIVFIPYHGISWWITTRNMPEQIILL